MQDIYDKQTGKRAGADSDADSDGGQIGFASHRPKKGTMSEEQVCLHRISIIAAS